MALLTDLKLNITLDQVLRSQGADPEIIRIRSPLLVDVAQRALETGLPMLEPCLAYREFKVRSLSHHKLILEEGELSGELIAGQLGPAERVVVMVCTIGAALEQYAQAMLSVDPPLGLALDALGSAAVDALTVAACKHFGDLAAAEGKTATLPLSPGMEGWPVDAGQLQVFLLVDPQEAGIELTSAGMMIPRKSLTLVMGIGENVAAEGQICDFCSLRLTCRFQGSHA